MRIRPGASAFFACALALAACGESTIIADGAEQSVVNVVSEQTDFTPTDVECPDDEPAEVGHTFECRFTGPEGPYTAFMEVLEVDGERVEFKILTRPTE